MHGCTPLWEPGQPYVFFAQRPGFSSQLPLGISKYRRDVAIKPPRARVVQRAGGCVYVNVATNWQELFPHEKSLDTMSESACRRSAIEPDLKRVNLRIDPAFRALEPGHNCIDAVGIIAERREDVAERVIF